MLTTVLILALCGVAGGYLVGRSALFEYSRVQWERKRDVLDAALASVLDTVQFGEVEGDTDILPVIPTGIPEGKERRRLTRRWALNYALSCNLCFGWWAAAAGLAVWAAGAFVFGQTAPVQWHEVLPAWGAACGVHTIITAIGNRVEVW